MTTQIDKSALAKITAASSSFEDGSKAIRLLYEDFSQSEGLPTNEAMAIVFEQGFRRGMSYGLEVGIRRIQDLKR